jgi:hypothetical protein
VSPMQVSFRSHSSHPRLNAWFVRRREYQVPHVTGLTVCQTKTGKFDVQEIHGPPVEYEYFHFPVLENDPDELRTVRDFMDREFLGFSANGIGPEMSKDEIYELLSRVSRIRHSGEYLPEKYGVLALDCLTEFDARLPLVTPLVPFRTDPRKDPKNFQAYLAEIKQIEMTEETTAEQPPERDK